MNIQSLIANAKKALQTNSPQVFTGLGIAGVITTAYLTGRASYKAALIIDLDESQGGTASDWKERYKSRGKLVWKLYVPPAASCVATIGCIYGVSRITSRRATAAATAYAVAERSFSDYRDKVEEELGKGKEQKIRDKVAQDKVTANPPSETYILDTGVVLCCELYTGRYFPSNREALTRAMNEVNERLKTDMFVTLSEFYHMIHMPETSQSDYLGWEQKEMYLHFTTTLSDQDKPCMAFDYSYVKPLN